MARKEYPTGGQRDLIDVKIERALDALSESGGGSAEYPDFTGNNYKALLVNSAASDVEWNYRGAFRGTVTAKSGANLTVTQETTGTSMVVRNDTGKTVKVGNVVCCVYKFNALDAVAVSLVNYTATEGTNYPPLNLPDVYPITQYGITAFDMRNTYLTRDYRNAFGNGSDGVYDSAITRNWNPITGVTVPLGLPSGWTLYNGVFFVDNNNDTWTPWVIALHTIYGACAVKWDTSIMGWDTSVGGIKTLTGLTGNIRVARVTDHPTGPNGRPFYISLHGTNYQTVSLYEINSTWNGFNAAFTSVTASGTGATSVHASSNTNSNIGAISGNGWLVFRVRVNSTGSTSFDWHYNDATKTLYAGAYSTSTSNTSVYGTFSSVGASVGLNGELYFTRYNSSSNWSVPHGSIGIQNVSGGMSVVQLLPTTGVGKVSYYDAGKLYQNFSPAVGCDSNGTIWITAMCTEDENATDSTVAWTSSLWQSNLSQSVLVNLGSELVAMNSTTPQCPTVGGDPAANSCWYGSFVTSTGYYCDIGYVQA